MQAKVTTAADIPRRPCLSRTRHAQSDHLVHALTDKLSQVAAHLDAACDDIPDVPQGDPASDLVERSPRAPHREIRRRTDVVDIFPHRNALRQPSLGEYEMNDHVVEYEPNRRIGWQPQAGNGHPRAGRFWGQRWSFELTPEGPHVTTVTEIYDCSLAPEAERGSIDNGNARIQSMTTTLQLLDAAAGVGGLRQSWEAGDRATTVRLYTCPRVRTSDLR